MRTLVLAALIVTLMVATHKSVQARTVLSVDGPHFAVNGKATFLFGISYYAGLGAPDDFVRRDLDDAQRLGLNWIRVWATWGAFDNDVSAVATDGSPREPYLGRLVHLVADCDRRGLVVDVTLTRGNGPGSLPSQPAHLRAVETLVAALQPYRNWYLDLSNERNVRDARYTSFSDLKTLRDAVKHLDPRRLLTASQGGDIRAGELQEYLRTVQVDFIAPHRPREAASPGQTEAVTRRYLEQMQRLGRVVPVHYQEPFRRGYGQWQPVAADYAIDLHGARAGGGAGWCFHNGGQASGPEGKPRRSFDLRTVRLFDALDPEERAALIVLQRALTPGG